MVKKRVGVGKAAGMTAEELAATGQWDEAVSERMRAPVRGSQERGLIDAHPGWTASTVKLAIAADLLRRDRAQQITLSAADRHDLATMLNFSDNAATDRLWKAYGDDARTFAALHDVDLDVETNDFLVITGRSGCGRWPPPQLPARGVQCRTQAAPLQTRPPLLPGVLRRWPTMPSLMASGLAVS